VRIGLVLLVMCVLGLVAGCSSSDADLSEAVAQGDHRRVQDLIDQGADLDSPVIMGMTPLMRASNRDSADLVARLIEGGAGVNATGADRLTPLHIAARANAVDSGRLLLEAGADPAARSLSGMNALDHAASTGSGDFISLLASTTDLDLDEPSQAVTQGHGYPRDAGPTPLGLATREGHTAAVATLLALGAGVDAPSASGHTPLLLAVFFDKPPEVVQALIAAGADVTASAPCDLGCSVEGGEPLTALEWAVELQREELIPLLHR
jgi:ankyrin repeat protein